MQYQNLFDLLSSNQTAQDYFNTLPDGARQKIMSKPGNITSLQSLKDYAENLARIE